jgi:hypothetical protein
VTPELKEILASLAGELRLVLASLRSQLKAESEELAGCIERGDLTSFLLVVNNISAVQKQYKEALVSAGSQLPRLIQVLDPELFAQFVNKFSHDNDKRDTATRLHDLNGGEIELIERLHDLNCQDPSCEVRVAIQRERQRRAG